MGHIHTKKGQYDFTIGAYIVRINSDGKYEVLLHKHRKINKLLPLGGHIELNETPWSAVAHELREEAGYDLGDLYILQPKDQIKKLTNIVVQPQPIVMASYDYDETHNHTDIAYAFFEKNPPSKIPDKGESLDFKWITIDKLLKLTDNDIFVNTKEIYSFVIEKVIETYEKVEANSFSTSFRL